MEHQAEALTRAGLPVKVPVSHKWSEDLDEQELLVRDPTSRRRGALACIGRLRSKDLSDDTLRARTLVHTGLLFEGTELPLPPVKGFVLPPQPPLAPLKLLLHPAGSETGGSTDAQAVAVVDAEAERVITMAVPGTRVAVSAMGCGTVVRHTSFGWIELLLDCPDPNQADTVVRLIYDHDAGGPFAAHAVASCGGMIWPAEADSADGAGGMSAHAAALLPIVERYAPSSTGSRGLPLAALFSLPALPLREGQRLLLVLPRAAGRRWVRVARKPERGFALSNSKLRGCLAKGQLVFDDEELDDFDLLKRGKNELITYDAYVECEPEVEEEEEAGVGREEASEEEEGVVEQGVAKEGAEEAVAPPTAAPASSHAAAPAAVTTARPSMPSGVSSGGVLGGAPRKKVYYQPISEASEIVQARVEAHEGEFLRPTRHRLKIGDPRGGERTIMLDLNPFNHSTQGFGTVGGYRSAVAGYCGQLLRETREVEDGITGVHLRTSELTSIAVGSAAAWTKKLLLGGGLAAALGGGKGGGGQGVGAAGGGMRSKLSKWGAVRTHEGWGGIKGAPEGSGEGGGAADGAASGGRSGQRTRSYISCHREVHSVKELAPALCEPAHCRVVGQHPTQPVLVCGSAGTGKTWACVQLAHELAKRCGDAATTDGVPLVPALIYVQRLARMLHERPEDAPIDASILVQYFARECVQPPPSVS